MSRPNVSFESTSDFLPSWNCLTRGSSKEQNLTYLEASEESWMIGYYISTREVEIKNKKYLKHKFKVTHVGRLEDLNGVEGVDAESGTILEVLGTGVLNNKIEESVQPGVYVEIKYLGRKKKKDSEETYHNWDVGIASGVEPIKVQNGVIVGDANSSNKEVAAAPAAAAATEGAPAQEAPPAQAATESAETVVAEGDDDLPF